jgi:hypothetical protein
MNISGQTNWYRDLGSAWSPEMSISYGHVFGSHEWIYTGFLACWKLISAEWLTWAIYSNAALAAIFPAASYAIVRSLNASHRAATCAAIITLIDPLSAVNASWILKDTFAGFFAVCAAWSVVRLLRYPNFPVALLMIILTATLGCIRFVGFIAVVISVAIVLPTLYTKTSRRSLVYLSSAIVGSIIIFCTIYTIPKITTQETFNKALISPLQSQQQTFETKAGTITADSSVINWKERWKSDPALAIVTSTARTLLAPYPWVAVTHGLSFKNGVELYFPGMLVWIACLPGLAWGMVLCLKAANRQVLFLTSMLFAILAAYTIFFGEWSTRQRVFMLPVLFSFAAIGWCDLYDRRKISSRG